ncbi:(R)-mandelonitrile lyase [Acuticoccus sediminis]|uniref:(R)-mandelonitrile lyase n=1 Tax=Acuticoccus sediminis TaxID=2184697 RepID=UPI001CFE6D79|nr:cupin domain-containing protein [Acuticoccus sediminis]
MKRIISMLVLTVLAMPALAQDVVDLQLIRPGSGEVVIGATENFTGRVEVGPLVPRVEPSSLGGGVVRFEAGAHTAWHTHPLGQTLHITEGCGWVQVEGQPVHEVTPGDIVVIPPETRHWHGASPSEPMTHLALAEARDGTSVTWMERVSADAYAAGANVEPVC